MILFYIAVSLFVITILYSVYENRRNNLKRLIQEKQLEFGSSEIEVKNRTYGKYGIAFSMVATMVITPFAFTGELCGDSIYCYNDELFQTVEVSAGEYLINLYGEGFSFGVNMFELNDSIVQYNDELSYYEGFNRYVSMDENIEFNTFEINGIVYASVAYDDYIDYLSIEYNEYGSTLRRFMFEFNDFEEDITTLHKLFEEYPPVVTRITIDETIPQYMYDFSPNESYLEIEDEYQKALYEMYFGSIINRTWSDPEDVPEMRRVEISYLIDDDDISVMGTGYYVIDKIKSANHAGFAKYDPLFSYNPFWTIEDESSSSSGMTYNDHSGEPQDIPGRIYNNNIVTDEYTDVYSTVVFDLSNVDEIENIEVIGSISGVELENYYIIDNVLVIPPTKVATIYKDGDHHVVIRYDFEVHINDVVLEQRVGVGFEAYWYN